MHVLALIFSLLAAPQTADVKTPPENAERTESGLITFKLGDGTGSEHPAADDLVKVRYSIWSSAGKLIDSVPSNRAAVMSVSRMMPGWRETISKMVVGEQRRAWISSDLGEGKIPAGSSYVIDTELVDIIHG